MKHMIRVLLPHHLRTLAHVGAEVQIEVEGPVTQRSLLDALEARYPMLRGTIRDHGTFQRRAFLRFFACEEDLSHESPDVSHHRGYCRRIADSGHARALPSGLAAS